MKLEDEVKIKLQNFPNFRERKQRSEYLTVLALRKLKLETKYKSGEQLSMKEMSQFGIKFDSYRRAWVEVTKHCEELRGRDYKEGEILAEEKMLELGYMPSHYQDVKQLALLK